MCCRFIALQEIKQRAHLRVAVYHTEIISFPGATFINRIDFLDPGMGK